MTACEIVHSLAGSPRLDGAVDIVGRCWVCAGEMQRGQIVGKWQGANFTDQNKARYPEGTHVCEPCVWAMSWVQPPGFPPPAPGKKGLNLRLFSHLHDGRGYCALNKADKPAMLAWLRGPKDGQWFASIADTGQKHVLPWAPINPAGTCSGAVRFEERNVALPASDNGWLVVDAAADLLSWGVTKDEIIRGDYSVRTHQSVPRNALLAFARDYGRHRGGAWFDLALWLSQRDEEKYADRRKQSRGAKNRDRKRPVGNAGDIPSERREPVEALAATTGSYADGGADKRKRAGLGDRDVPQSPVAGGEQLALFGDHGANGRGRVHP